MGVGSAGIQVGDCVVVIRGVNVPMVVRRVGGGGKEGEGSGEGGERVGEGEEEGGEEGWEEEWEEEEERYRLIGPAQILGLDLGRWPRQGEVRDWENRDEDVEIVLV